MEHQKIINLLGNTPNQSSKFRTKNWVEINNESRGTYNANSQIKFKTTMLKSSLCDYSDAYILVKGTITVPNTAAEDADVNNANKKVVFKNCAPFINCVSKINNGDDGTKEVQIMVPLKYLSNFWKTLEMPLINCEVKLILTWSANCVIAYTNVTNQGATFAITETKLYVPIVYVPLSTKDNANC